MTLGIVQKPIFINYHIKSISPFQSAVRKMENFFYLRFNKVFFDFHLIDTLLAVFIWRQLKNTNQWQMWRILSNFLKLELNSPNSYCFPRSLKTTIWKHRRKILQNQKICLFSRKFCGEMLIIYNLWWIWLVCVRSMVKTVFSRNCYKFSTKLIEITEISTHPHHRHCYIMQTPCSGNFIFHQISLQLLLLVKSSVRVKVLRFRSNLLF